MNDEEEWRELKAYPGYMISDQGNVRGPKGKILKPQPNGIRGGGFPTVTLVIGGRRHKRRIHQLMVLAFTDLAS